MDVWIQLFAESIPERVSFGTRLLLEAHNRLKVFGRDQQEFDISPAGVGVQEAQLGR